LNSHFRLVVALLSIGLLFACSAPAPKSRPPGPQPEWSFEKEAIRLSFQADRDLNQHDGLRHALSVCVYQLKDPNAFNQLASDRNGLYVLLGCETFDPSVTSFRRITVQPGQELDLTLDRGQASRYVGIAAGYYSLEREKITRLVEIPVEVKSTGVIFKDKYAIPGGLNLRVVLGTQAIEKVEPLR
jgi:type VI secretion system VasD/TssJ family lipoprotein